MFKYIMILMIIMFGSQITNAQEWVTSDIVPPYIEVCNLPTQSFSTRLDNNPYRVMTYQWIPYVYNVPIIEQRHTIFGHKTIIIYKPVIYWVYQLAYVR